MEYIFDDVKRLTVDGACTQRFEVRLRIIAHCAQIWNKWVAHARSLARARAHLQPEYHSSTMDKNSDTKCGCFVKIGRIQCDMRVYIATTSHNPFEMAQFDFIIASVF